MELRRVTTEGVVLLFRFDMGFLFGTDPRPADLHVANRCDSVGPLLLSLAHATFFFTQPSVGDLRPCARILVLKLYFLIPLYLTFLAASRAFPPG